MSQLESLHVDVLVWSPLRFVALTPDLHGLGDAIDPASEARRRLDAFEKKLAEQTSGDAVPCAICREADRRGAFVRVRCRIDVAEDQCVEIDDLAREHGLAIYDPQGPELTYPTAVGDRSAIADALASFGADGHGYVVLSAGADLEHYVQCSFHGEVDAVRVEAVSNRFLRPSARISRASEARLRLLGFRAPSAEHGNFRQSVRVGSTDDAARIASLAIDLLREVYGHADDAPLDLRILRTMEERSDVSTM